jgi:hypothetical protein
MTAMSSENYFHKISDLKLCSWGHRIYIAVGRVLYMPQIGQDIYLQATSL